MEILRLASPDAAGKGWQCSPPMLPFAVQPLCDFLGKLFLLLLEYQELDFDEFVSIESDIYGNE